MKLACIAFGLLAGWCPAGAPAPRELAGLRASVAEERLVESVLALLHEERGHLSPGALASVYVEARGSLVLLQGRVPDIRDKLLIELLARGVQGVRAVANGLVVPGELPHCGSAAPL